MERSQVRCFLSLADTHDARRSALACKVTEAELVSMIHRLEREMGGPLFRSIGGAPHRHDELHLPAAHAGGDELLEERLQLAMADPGEGTITKQ